MQTLYNNWTRPLTLRLVRMMHNHDIRSLRRGYNHDALANHYRPG